MRVPLRRGSTRRRWVTTNLVVDVSLSVATRHPHLATYLDHLFKATA